MTTTTIQVNTDVCEMLKALGRKGETYNDIIVKLMKRIDYEEFMKECYGILDNEKKWVRLEDDA